MSDDKNPLDVLEDLLNENSKGGSGSGDPKKPAEKTDEELAKELEQRRKEYEQKHQEQTAVDEQKLVEQRQAILSIKDTKEYHARVQQESEKQVESEKKAQAADGFEITQLGHTKV